MKLNPQQIKYQRMETGKQKSITQKDLKIIIIKRIKVKIEIKNKLEGEKKSIRGLKWIRKITFI
jgi:hypothetical protein